MQANRDKFTLLNILSCILSVCGTLQLEAQTYTNITNNVFAAASPTQINESDVNWGDYDNDGDLDILAVGFSNGLGDDTYDVQIYRNDGGNFSPIYPNLAAIQLPVASWADYDQDGDLDILLLGMDNSYQPFGQLYRNTNGNFTPVSTNIPGCFGSSADWGDYDNDGDMDLLMAGFRFEDRITKLFRNDGNSQFTEVNVPFPGVEFGELVWMDYDRDGDLDVILTGEDQNNVYRTEVFTNTNGHFSINSNLSNSLPKLTGGNLAIADYDTDGDMDVLLAGELNGGTYMTRIYRYDNGFFSEINSSITGVKDGGVSWGDYNGDGLPDFAITGLSQSSRTSKLYMNSGNGLFSPIVNLAATEKGNIRWGDFNNDNDLDILLTGRISSEANSNHNRFFGLYQKNGLGTNTPPNPPPGLQGSVNGGEVTLSWGNGSDGQTPSAGLSYNIRVGTSSGARDLVSPMSHNNGYRKIVKHGNVQQNKSWKIKNLPNGTYYWSVQSIDGNYAGSAFATEQTFVVEQQAIDLSFEIFGINNICYQPNGQVNVAAYVQNSGSNATSSFQFNIYLSTNAQFDAADILLSNQFITSIPSNTIVERSTVVRLPSSLSGGGYYLIGSLDHTQLIAESNENNNQQAISISISPTVDAGEDFSICPGPQTFVLSGMSPLGGIWSGNGITSPSGEFSPLVAGLGSHTLTYSYTTNGCTATDTRIITVSDGTPPTLICSASININTSSATCDTLIGSASLSPIYSDNCIAISLSYTLTGATTGSGNGSLSSRRFNKGTSTVMYTARDIAGNSSSCSFSIEVSDNQIPTISCPNNIIQFVPLGSCSTLVNYPLPTYSDNCSNATLQLVAGLPPGNFPIGTSTQLYKVTDNANNSHTCSFSVSIVPNGQIDAGPDLEVCLNEPSFSMLAGTSGGLWSGPGITNSAAGIVNPSIAGVGIHAMVYTIGQGSCPFSDTAIVTISDTTVIQAVGDLSFCLNEGSYIMESMNPVGGIWQGIGLTNGGMLFQPSLAGTGIHQLTYKYTNASACLSTFTRNITVNMLPNVDAGNDTVYAFTNTPQLLPLASPAGGRWFGPGVSDPSGVFIPSSVAVGIHRVYYAYTNSSSGCGDTASIQVTVDPSLVQMDAIHLNEGWNLISTDVVPEDSSITSVFSQLLPNNLVYVTGFHAGAVVYDPILPPFLNTLTHIKANYGYWVRVNQAATLQITGKPIDPSQKRNLSSALNNLIAYIPQQAQSPADYFQSLINNNQLLVVSGFDRVSTFYDPLLPPFFNSLDSLRNGFGYYVQVTQDIHANGYRYAAAHTPISPDYMFVSGQVDSKHISLKTLLNLQTQEGKVLAAVEVTEEGYLKPTPVYGDNPYTDEIDGLKEGAVIWLTYEGQRLYPAITFVADRSIHRSKFDFSQINLNIYPNPVGSQLNIDYELPQMAKVEISLYGLQGRKIQTILKDSRAAGSYHLLWNTNALAEGIYFIRFKSDERSIIWKKIVFLR